MMLFVLALGFLAVSGTVVHAAPTYLEEVQLGVSNYIDDLVRKALEYIRTLLKKDDPFHVPDMPQQIVEGDDVKLVINFNNLLMSNASDFIIDNINNNILGMWAKFNVTVPSLHLEGGYEIMGNVKGKAVTGNGHFRLNMTQLATGGYVKVGFSNMWLQMTELDIDYTLNGIEFEEDGMVIDGMTPEEINAFFSSTFSNYLQTNSKFVGSQVASYVKGIANGIMHGKNLKELIEWLEKMIHGDII